MNYPSDDTTDRKAADTAESIPPAAKQTVAATAHLASEKLREQSGVAKDKILHRLDGQIERQMENAASQVAGFGEAVREAGLSLQERNHARTAEYVGRVAERIESLAHRVETAHPKDLYRSANELAQRRPKMTVAALFLGGFALGRFLRASGAHDGEWETDRNGRTEDPTGRWLDDGGEPLNRESSDRYPAGSMHTSRSGSFESATDGGTFRNPIE